MSDLSLFIQIGVEFFRESFVENFRSKFCFSTKNDEGEDFGLCLFSLPLLSIWSKKFCWNLKHKIWFKVLTTGHWLVIHSYIFIIIFCFYQLSGSEPLFRGPQMLPLKDHQVPPEKRNNLASYYFFVKFDKFIVNVSLQLWCQTNDKKRALNKMCCDNKIDPRIGRFDWLTIPHF